jgi:Zn-dependent peptidase ImmA (M78 family)
VKHRRGFKAEAERISEEIRGELQLSPKMALDVFNLSGHLAIPVLGLRNVSNGSEGIDFYGYFSVTDPDTFSAITIFRGYQRFIIHNDSHHPNRQSSNIAHELSHCLLEHCPTPLRGNDGQRNWDAEMEGEATWLGASLLVPRAGALSLLRAGSRVDQIATHYAVSTALCEWRIRESGIRTQLQRSR